MAILVDANTRVICQGITGKQATFYCERAMATGTSMVGGVNPRKGGTEHLDVPVFASVAEARVATAASASMVMVPPAYAAAAMIEGIEASMPLMVCITEKIPVLDMVRVKAALKGSDTRLIGPNCPGVVTPGACQIGIMPSEIFSAGRIGIVSRSGTLTYEAIAQTSAAGLGQSTCVGIGADPVQGMSFVDTLKLFMQDDDTDAIVMIGEIGGSAEEQAADYLRELDSSKPVIAYIAGVHAPRGRRMGHAGAIQDGVNGSALQKRELLSAAGVAIAQLPADIGPLVQSGLAVVAESDV